MNEIGIPYRPRPWFAAWHERTQRNSVIVAHRRAGKSFAHIQDAVRKLMECDLPDPNAAYIAPLYRQVKRIAWKYLKKIALAFGKGARIIESDLTVIFPGNRTFTLYGADRQAGEALRGDYLDVVVVDEPEQIRGWQDFYAGVLQPMLSDRNGWLSVIGTVKGRGVLYKLVRDAQKEAHEWWYSVITVEHTDVYSAAKLERFRRNMGDAHYRQEFLCDWDIEGDDQFISGRDLADAVERTPYQRGETFIGVDVARYGDDRSVILVRNRDSIDDIIVRRKLDLMQLADVVADTARRFQPRAIFVDAVGVGAGVVDALRRTGHDVIEVHSGSKPGDEDKFLNRRSEMWWRMRDWIRHPNTSLKVEAFQKELEDDLTSLKFKITPRGQVQMEAKADLKKRGMPSPDMADALALTFASIIVPKEVQKAMRVNWAVEEASPFADL